METYTSVIQINSQTLGANVSIATASTGHIHAYFMPLHNAFNPCNITPHHSSSNTSVTHYILIYTRNYAQTPNRKPLHTPPLTSLEITDHLLSHDAAHMHG